VAADIRRGRGFVQYHKKKKEDILFHPGTHGGVRNILYEGNERQFIVAIHSEKPSCSTERLCDVLRTIWLPSRCELGVPFVAENRLHSESCKFQTERQVHCG